MVKNRGRIGIYLLLLLIGLILGGIIGGEFVRRAYYSGGMQGSGGDTVDNTDLSPGGQSDASDRAQGNITNSRKSAIVVATQEVEQCVVSIIVTQLEFVGSSYYYEDFFDMFFMPKLVPKYREVRNMGSGFVISKDGLILTNNHVVDKAKKLFINFPDGRKIEGKIVGQDIYSDLAVVSVKEGGDFECVTFGNSDDLMIGEWVIAIGNPFLDFFDARPTVTVGVVSALNRNFAPGGKVYYQNMIQTDAAINPGNSGGPLINALGEVIGINSFIYEGTKKTGRNPTGIGFAIPVNRADRVVNELVKYGRRRQVWTGISVQDIDRSIALALGLENARGVLITELWPGDPGIKAGLKVNDIIIQMGNRAIRSIVDFDGFFVNYFPGDKLKVTVIRSGKKITKTMVLEEFKSK
jgi:serine protease Do